MDQIKLKQEIFAQNLYQIPSCTICLSQMVTDTVNLSCGHCFHLNCISQHLQYRGDCPNCKKRASAKQIRMVYYQVVLNSKAIVKLRNIISSLDSSQVKQIKSLLKQIHNQTNEQSRVIDQKKELQKQTLQFRSQIQKLKKSVSQKSIQLQYLRRQNIALQATNKHLNDQILNHQKHQTNLRIELDKYHKQQKEYEQMRRLKKIMLQNSQVLARYKNQLQSKQTPPQEMVKLFYELLQMKNLEIIRTKDKLKEYPELIASKQSEISKLKQQIQKRKKQQKEQLDKKIAQKRKYQELKRKYRELMEKARQKGVKQNEMPQLQDSQNNFYMKSPHVPQNPIIESVLMINNTKKIGFNLSSTSTFGGFGAKKK